jgi:hypothetical protein
MKLARLLRRKSFAARETQGHAIQIDLCHLIGVPHSAARAQHLLRRVFWMSRMLFVSVLLLGCSVYSSLLTGCGSTNKVSSSRDNESVDAGMWTDPTTSLVWQEPQFVVQRSWAEAATSCNELELAGYQDWRLPTIDELRSLARGCDATVTGGACGVTDDCLETACSSAACDGCAEYGGPDPEGCYRPSSLTADCMTTWTSDVPPDMPDDVWTVGFAGCHVRHFPKTWDNLNTRCVR